MLPALVSNALEKMDETQKAEYLEEYRRNRKSLTFAYMAWILVGFHYAYLGRWGVQLIFWLTAGGFLVWWLLDLFRMPLIVQKKNSEIAVETMKDYRLITA